MARSENRDRPFLMLITRVANSVTMVAWDVDAHLILNEYFNLCGEEYLVWKQGYLYPEVWKSWRKGMQYFFDQPRVREIWEKELSSDSYYGIEKALKRDRQL